MEDLYSKPLNLCVDVILTRHSRNSYNFLISISISSQDYIAIKRLLDDSNFMISNHLSHPYAVMFITGEIMGVKSVFGCRRVKLTKHKLKFLLGNPKKLYEVPCIEPPPYKCFYLVATNPSYHSTETSIASSYSFLITKNDSLYSEFLQVIKDSDTMLQ